MSSIDLVKIDVEGYGQVPGFDELLQRLNLSSSNSVLLADSRVYFQDLWYFQSVASYFWITLLAHITLHNIREDTSAFQQQII